MDIFFYITGVATALIFCAIYYVKPNRRKRTRFVLPPLELPDTAEPADDFICLFMGDKGSIASAGGVTVRVTRITDKAKNPS